MLTRFYARNYKGLQMEPLSLGAVNLFIGPNNCGKSNLFSAVSFLFDMFGRPEEARGTLQAALQRRKRSPLATRGKTDIRLAWDFPGDFPVNYSLTLLAQADQAVAVLAEHAEAYEGAGNRFQFDIGADGTSTWTWDPPTKKDWPYPGRCQMKTWPSPTSLLQRAASDREFVEVSATNPRVLTELTFTLALEASYLMQVAQTSLTVHLSRFVPADIAEPRKAASVDSLDERGLDLSNLLHGWLKIPEVHDRLVAELNPLLQGLEELRVYEGGGHRWIQLKLSGAWLNLSELSDGTVILVALAALLFGPERRETLCLDEPELNLHPAWARVVAGWIIRQTAWKQVLVGTHSPEILDPLTEHFQRGEVSLFVFQRAEEGYKIEPCPPERLAASLEEGWLLGDLYRIGEPALGGWPW